MAATGALDTPLVLELEAVADDEWNEFREEPPTRKLIALVPESDSNDSNDG